MNIFQDHTEQEINTVLKQPQPPGHLAFKNILYKNSLTLFFRLE